MFKPNKISVKQWIPELSQTKSGLSRQHIQRRVRLYRRWSYSVISRTLVFDFEGFDRALSLQLCSFYDRINWFVVVCWWLPQSLLVMDFYLVTSKRLIKSNLQLEIQDLYYNVAFYFATASFRRAYVLARVAQFHVINVVCEIFAIWLCWF